MQHIVMTKEDNELAAPTLSSSERDAYARVPHFVVFFSRDNASLQRKHRPDALS